MDDKVRAAVVEFCHAWPKAHGIHVEIYDGDLMKDVQEFPNSMGGRPEAVADYVDGRPAKLAAIQYGRMREDGRETFYLARAESPAGPSRGTATIRHRVSFRGTQMGCKALGYCEREGRDRTEEERRYGEFLSSKGIPLVGFEDGWAVVRATTPTP